jgi:hypothetical protein
MEEETKSQMQDDEVALETTNDENLENEVVEEEKETVEEPQETEPQEEELSPRQQKRVEQIEEMKLNKILDRVTGGKVPAQNRSGYNPLDYKQTIDADDEVVSQLTSDREQYGQDQRSQGQAEAMEQLKYVEWKNNIRFDLPMVKEKLDQLPPAVALAIDQEYMLYSGFDKETGRVANPNISYAEFVEAQIERAEAIASIRNQDSQKNIVKQAAQTGIRPNGATSRPNKITSPEDIASISQDDWEKNRASYLQQMGINYKPQK